MDTQKAKKWVKGLKMYEEGKTIRECLQASGVTQPAFINKVEVFIASGHITRKELSPMNQAILKGLKK